MRIRENGDRFSWDVQSESDPTKIYRVQPYAESERCECKSWQHRGGTCKHMVLADKEYHKKSVKYAIASERAHTKEEFLQAWKSFNTWKQLEPKPDKE